MLSGKSDTEQSDPDDAGKNDESPKKRTRPSTPFVAATTSRSPDRKASVSERQEEEYLSGLDDSMDMERMTRSQHNGIDDLPYFQWNLPQPSIRFSLY